MKTFSLSALVAAGLFAGGLMTSAQAADLGGDCCADLEERIAELEATTVRKGNRKVSLTISGWVGEQVMYWDDGFEENFYQTGLGTTLSSNFKFSGQAQITPGWSAGYLIHVEVGTADNLGVDQGNSRVFGTTNSTPVGMVGDDAANLLSGGSGVQLLQSYWFVKSDHLGKLSVGQVSQASDNTAILVDGSGSLVQANWVAFDTNSFLIRSNDTPFTDAYALANGLRWGNAGSCRGMGGAWGDCNGLVLNGVRYDTPTFAGFSLSAGWGEDDFWDIAIRYAGEFHQFKLAVAAAYNESNEPFALLAAGVHPNSLQYFQAGIYVQHIPTGLFLLYNYGHLDEDRDVAGGGRLPPPDTETHYLKGGVRSKFSHLGHTIFYGEWLHNDDGSALIGTGFQFNFNPANGAAAAYLAPTSSELNVYGFGIVQEIDAAAMSVWIKYRHLEYDDNALYSTTAAPAVRQIGWEDFDYVAVGALINF